MIPEATSDDAEAESARFAEEVNNAKSQLLADKEAEIPEATPIYDAAISLNDLKSAITTFDVNNDDEVQTYEIDGFTYIVVLRDKKEANEHWYNFATVR
ncbi:hypothetical protein IJL65_00035 [bacterium]|nr:hypothetical protein [bacterium]